MSLFFDKLLNLTTDGQSLQRRLDICFDKITQFSKDCLLGVSDGSAASSGQIGEVLTNTRVTSASLMLTTTIASGLTSITLSPGDWDVSGIVLFQYAASTTSSALSGWVNTSITEPSFNTGQQAANGLPIGPNAQYLSLTIPTFQLSLASSITIYLGALAVFSTSTLNACGTIRARRMR